MTPIRVVLVEDNDGFRETLELLFGMRDEVEVVGSVATGDDASALCASVRPDVVLMDYRMPGLNGAEATRAVLLACPETRVVGSVATGDDASALCASVRPDVVLMDYRMPGLNGAEATRAVLIACPETRVVCLSASVTQQEIDEVRAAGAVACVTKDEDFDRLIATVCKAAA